MFYTWQGANRSCTGVIFKDIICITFNFNTSPMMPSNPEKLVLESDLRIQELAE